MDHYEKFFKAGLAGLGYEVLYRAKKEDDSQSDGLCVCWKSSRFTLTRSRVLSFVETMKHLPDATPNIALFLELEDKLSGRKLVVANTHLYWHWDHDALRAVQAQFLFERLLQWIDNPEGDFIVCGDFNSDPTSIAYRLVCRRPIPPDHFAHQMSNSVLDAEGLHRLRTFFDEENGFPMVRSAYACQSVRPDKVFGAYGELPWSTWNTFKDNLDYIFFRQRARVMVRRLLMLPPDELVSSETALPNHTYVSDHMALVAEFAFTDTPCTQKT